MVAHYAKHTFVVVASAGGLEVDYNTLTGVWLHSVHILREAKHVFGVSNKLALSGQITVVAHIQNTIGLSVKLYFTKVKSFRAQLNIKAFSLAAAREIKFIATFNFHFVVGA
jgi:hypothetical protein